MKTKFIYLILLSLFAVSFSKKILYIIGMLGW